MSAQGDYRSEKFDSLTEHVLDIVRRAGHDGIWTLRIREIIDAETPRTYRVSYNSISGTLSRLADDGKVARLAQKVQGRRRWLAREYVTDEPAMIDEIEEENA